MIITLILKITQIDIKCYEQCLSGYEMQYRLTKMMIICDNK